MKIPPSDSIAKARYPRPRGYIDNWSPTAKTEELLSHIADALDRMGDVLPRI